MQALYSYNAKLAQLDRFMEYNLDLLVVDYDDLIQNKEQILPFIYEFIGSKYKEEYGNLIHPKSLNKGNSLSNRQTMLIKKNCDSKYQAAQKYISYI